MVTAKAISRKVSCEVFLWVSKESVSIFSLDAMWALGHCEDVEEIGGGVSV